MDLAIAPGQAGLLLLGALPFCLYVAWSDLRAMRIPNRAVLGLLAVFLVLAPFVMGWGEMGLRLAALLVVLVIGFAANAAGALGGGDAKFAAAAAPFIAPGDWGRVMVLLALVTLAAVVTHRGAARSPLRRLAPEWESWTRTQDFPLGLALGGTLALYLALGAA